MVTNHDYSQLSGISDDSRVFSDDDGKMYFSVCLFGSSQSKKNYLKHLSPN